MRVTSMFLMFLMLMATSLSAQEKQKSESYSKADKVLNFNNMTTAELLSLKALQSETIKPDRQLDQKLSLKGYHYPAITKVTDEGKLREFSFTDIITSDEPGEIKSFTQKVKNANLEGLVEITISATDHQCKLTVDQNIAPAMLSHIFSALGFDGYIINTQN